MSLPNEPVIKKFLTNKIESSRDDWYGYLIKIAHIFYSIDGHEYNRDDLLQHFTSISQRDMSAERDAANFRDEFGAYGTYLGIFHFEEKNGKRVIVVSNAAKQFLCTETPNVAAFCRAQLSLFQYPNGAGASISANGGIAVQGNIKIDTLRELDKNIHLNPFRLVCRIAVMLHERLGIKINAISIPYDTLFCMVNDDRINQVYNPPYEILQAVWLEFNSQEFVNNMNMEGLGNFKRNFHIMEKTGLFVRDSRFGMIISPIQTDIAYSCIREIADITDSFNAFDGQFFHPSEEIVKKIITSPSWGKYYDAANLPLNILEKLGVELDRAPIFSRSFSKFDNDDVYFREREKIRVSGGENILLYGVPGSGKSWTIEHEYCGDDVVVERLVFHPDYTNADFIGQILPVVDDDKQVSYEFSAGPFTTIIKNAYENPDKKYVLIIEEINRGNAPAIFGEVFQLLDRTVESKTIDKVAYHIGTSEYGISHKNMAEEIYGDSSRKVRIPSNLSIVGTMNTSDQNVFTLDTAFQRRWQMRLIENNFTNVRSSLTDAEILDTKVTWRTFCEKTNSIIIGNRSKMASAEDKRLGVYFIHENYIKTNDLEFELTGDILAEYDALIKKESTKSLSDEAKARLSEIRTVINRYRIFPEKVIKYLWDDAFKFNPEAIFDTEKMESLEQIIHTFIYAKKGEERFNIFKSTFRESLYNGSNEVQ